VTETHQQYETTSLMLLTNIKQLIYIFIHKNISHC